MRIHRLTTGRVRGPSATHGLRRYLAPTWSDSTLPVNAFLLDHPAGLCLVDAGQGAAAAGALPRWHPFLRIARFELGSDDEAAAQVRRLGHRPEDVRWVVLTHLHTDHIGGLAGFPGAEAVVADAEWRRARGLAGRLRGYVPGQWPEGLEPRRVDLSGPPVGPFPASLDLAGDGSLRLVPLPGHTPGHLGVLVAGALLGGDAAHDPGELQALDPAVAAYCRTAGLRFLAAHDDAIPAVVEV